MHNPKDKKPYRDADEENTLLEGRNAVTELLRSGQACDKVFIAQGARMGEILTLAKARGVPVVQCDRRKLDAMSQTGNHQGVIAQAAAHA